MNTLTFSSFHLIERFISFDEYFFFVFRVKMLGIFILSVALFAGVVVAPYVTTQAFPSPLKEPSTAAPISWKTAVQLLADQSHKVCWCIRFIEMYFNKHILSDQVIFVNEFLILLFVTYESLGNQSNSCKSTKSSVNSRQPFRKSFFLGEFKCQISVFFSLFQ